MAHAWQSCGPTLECGSGLSTLLLGVIAQQRGHEHWALEHKAEWADKVERGAERHGLRAVRVHTAPLKRYAGYTWYDPPFHEMPRHFALAVCDGPPADTPGGRYGLVPVMRERLSVGCVILLDDAEREHEREIAQRWQTELGASHELIDCGKPLIRMVVNGHDVRSLLRTGT
jgi:flavin-dependent dehydrogenase